MAATPPRTRRSWPSERDASFTTLSDVPVEPLYALQQETDAGRRIVVGVTAYTGAATLQHSATTGAKLMAPLMECARAHVGSNTETPVF